MSKPPWEVGEEEEDEEEEKEEKEEKEEELFDKEVERRLEETGARNEEAAPREPGWGTSKGEQKQNRKWTQNIMRKGEKEEKQGRKRQKNNIRR